MPPACRAQALRVSRRLRRPWKKKGDFARTPRAPAGGRSPPAPPAEELRISTGLARFAFGLEKWECPDEVLDTRHDGPKNGYK